MKTSVRESCMLHAARRHEIGGFVPYVHTLQQVFPYKKDSTAYTA